MIDMRWLVSPPQTSKDQNRFRKIFVRRLSRIFAVAGEAAFASASALINGSQKDASVSTNSGAGADQQAQQRPGSRLPGNAHLPCMWPMVLHAVRQPRPLVHALQSTVAFSRALACRGMADRATQRDQYPAFFITTPSAPHASATGAKSNLTKGKDKRLQCSENDHMVSLNAQKPRPTRESPLTSLSLGHGDDAHTRLRCCCAAALRQTPATSSCLRFLRPMRKRCGVSIAVEPTMMSRPVALATSCMTRSSE